MKLTNLLAVVALFFFAAQARAADSCSDTGKIYKVCSDQEASYKDALAKAKADGKTLVVVLGAEWCPWCLSLHGLLTDPKFGGEFAKKYVLTDVAMYKAKEKVPSGVSVLNKLKEQAHFTGKTEGIPVMAMVNPQTEKTVLIDTEPLERNTKITKGHDPKKVLAALEKAAGELK